MWHVLVTWISLPKLGLKCHVDSFSFIELPLFGVPTLIYVPHPGQCLWLCLTSLHRTLFVKRRTISRRHAGLLWWLLLQLITPQLNDIASACLFKNPFESHDWYLLFDETVGRLSIASVRKSSLMCKGFIGSHSRKSLMLMSSDLGLETPPELCLPAVSSFAGALWWQDGWQRL